MNSHFQDAETFIDYVIKEANIDKSQSKFLYDHFKMFLKENILTFNVSGELPPYVKCAISEEEWNNQMKEKVVINLKKELSEQVAKRVPAMSDITGKKLKCELKVWIK